MQKIVKKLKEYGVSVALLGLWLGLLNGCGDDGSSDYTQVERLARPAINEGLVLSSRFLKAFNEIAPSVDLTAAAADVVTEVQAVLDLIETKATNSTALSLDPRGTKGGTDDLKQHVAKGFLPDVMRFRMTGESGFVVSGKQGSANLGKVIAGETVALVDSKYLIPIGGRTLRQDVGDIILTYLFDGDRLVTELLAGKVFPSEPAATSTLTFVLADNVSFDGAGALQGKTKGLISTFPYLGRPN